MLNQLTGTLLYLLVFTPVLLTQSALILFLFVDRLIAKEYDAAFTELVNSPLKIVEMLMHSIILVSMSGWQAGATGIIMTNKEQLTDFFSAIHQTEPSYFFATFYSHYLIMYPGKYVGAMLRRLSLLQFPAAFFDFYQHYDRSQHNPIENMTSNQLYDLVDELYGQKTKEHLPTIQDDIRNFLHAHEPMMSPNDRTVVYARRCFDDMQQDIMPQSHDLQIKTTHHLKKTTLNVLCLIWQTIEEYHLNPQKKTEFQQLVMTYLANLQRGHSADPLALDNPECRTGIITSLLTLLPILDRQRFSIQPSQTDSWSKMQRLLVDRMNQKYFECLNSFEDINQMLNKSSQQTNKSAVASHSLQLQSENMCLKKGDLVLKYYALFLNNTPQGRAATGLPELPEDGVIATAEQVVNEWHRPE